MEKLKSLATKILLATMILALFSTTLVHSNASAASSVSITQEKTKSMAASGESFKAAALPPRKPPKDPVMKAFYFALVAFVGVTLASTIVSNAINNGIDAACKKWDKKWGVKQACKVVS
jgi:hypothetical protein